MTARVKSLGTVVFLYKQWVDEFEKPSDVNAVNFMSAAGTHITYSSVIQTPYISLVSKEHGWLSEQNVSDIKAMYEQLGTSFTLVYDDDSTETVRFAHEKPSVFTPLYEGACYYTASINLAKVI